MMKPLIDVNASFQHLPHAPIVEAVIDIRARAATVLEESLLKKQLEAKLIGYQFLDSQRQIQIQHEVNLQSEALPSQTIRDVGWKGLRFQSADKKHIVHFNRDGYIFSRLEPYQGWDSLYQEGMRLWRIYVELARPVEVHRVGLRYINRIQLPPDVLRFEDYFERAPVPPKGLDLPFYGFMHQDTLAIPESSYAINVIKTIQPPKPAGVQGLGLILDIDAFTSQGFELNDAVLAQRLLEMRWLKNKVFFGSVTSKALKLFQ